MCTYDVFYLTFLMCASRSPRSLAQDSFSAAILDWSCARFCCSVRRSPFTKSIDCCTVSNCSFSFSSYRKTNRTIDTLFCSTEFWLTPDPAYNEFRQWVSANKKCNPSLTEIFQKFCTMNSCLQWTVCINILCVVRETQFTSYLGSF